MVLADNLPWDDKIAPGGAQRMTRVAKVAILPLIDYLKDAFDGCAAHQQIHDLLCDEICFASAAHVRMAERTGTNCTPNGGQSVRLIHTMDRGDSDLRVRNPHC